MIKTMWISLLSGDDSIGFRGLRGSVYVIVAIARWRSFATEKRLCRIAVFGVGKGLGYRFYTLF